MSANADALFNLWSEIEGKEDIISWSLVKGRLSLFVDGTVDKWLWQIAEAKEPEDNGLSEILAALVSKHNKEAQEEYQQKYQAYKEGKRRSRPQKPKDIEPSTISPYFKSVPSQRAFVKAYFLYEFLTRICKLEFTQLDFNRALKGDPTEAVSQSISQNIRLRLNYERVLYVDVEGHNRSLNKENKTPYRYVFHPIMEHIPRDHSSKKEYSYQLKGELAEEVATYKKISKSKDISRVWEIILRGCAGDNSSEFIHNKLINSMLVQKSILLSAPYDKLELAGMTPQTVASIGKYSKLKIWLQWHKEKPKETISSRIWHPFHTLPREYRKYITYQGSPIVEAMDVHNCFYVLMTKAMRLSSLIGPNELAEYERLVRSGKFYEAVEQYVLFRDGMPIDETGINYYEEEYLWFRGYDKRALVKLWLQSYRNFILEGHAQHQHRNIDKFYREQFPTIRDWLFSYDTGLNSEGKRVKLLQSDMCRIESRVIGDVCRRLIALGTTPFSLHDAIYLNKADMDKLSGMGVDVEAMFWDCFDALSNNEVKAMMDLNRV